MNLDLFISKRQVNQYDSHEKFVFAVVDLDKSDIYPFNFVCVLPLLNYAEKNNSNFSKKFGKQNLLIAQKLLTQALSSESDPELKAEIERRLKMLKPKSFKVVCKSCKTVFETSNSHGLKICLTCKNKIIKEHHTKATVKEI